MKEYAIVIIGGGVTGVALARELARRGVKRIAVLEKEGSVARHTSGHNSGVAHAGYNPKPGSLKARLCVEGNRELKDFCKNKGVPLVEGGILIVSPDGHDRDRLEELHRRGVENGVPGIRLIGGGEIPAIEPNARGALALHAPSGASVDSVAFVQALAAEARDAGVEFHFATRVDGVKQQASGFTVLAGGEKVRAARLVNCAGLHADRIAHALGAGLDYGIVPIRGEYRTLRPEAAGIIRSMVYPVPDHDFPFLGVHWTKSAHGEVLIGPNAVPAFGREAYSWRGSSLLGALEMAADARAWRLLFQPGFPRLLAGQLRTSFSTAEFARQARALVPAARPEDFRPGPAGVRAQLVDRSGKMVEDLVVEENGAALHVLNVVSPGLTCSMAFARHLADRLG